METPPAGTPVAVKAVATAALSAPPSVMRTPPPVVTRTPPPVVTRSAQLGATPTPPPVMTMRTPRPRRPSAPQQPLSFDEDAGRIGPRTKFALAGLVLTAFSCGMMFMVAVDRFWPRPRAQCEAAPSEMVTAPTSTKTVEAARERAAVAPALAAPADPVEAYSKRLAAQAPVEPLPAARALPAARPSPAPAPRVVQAPAPRVPAAAPAVVARGRATVTARKRPATAGVAAETAAPTEGWNDPFAQ